MTTLADRLKELRKSKNLTQTDLGKILGVGKTTISMYETNNSTPNDEIKLKIAEFFNVSLDYLLGKTDYKKFNPEQLTDKDKKDIKKDLKDIIDDFRNKKGNQKYYNGVELDDEGLDLMEAAMNIALEQIKIRNKKKYTPNKYKK